MKLQARDIATYGCAAIIGLFIVFIIGANILFGYGMRQKWHTPYLSSVESPNAPRFRLLFVRGFYPNDAAILAQVDNGTPTRILEISEQFGDTFFVQWTKDGTVAVFTFEPDTAETEPRGSWTDRVYHAGAYDFNSGNSILEHKGDELDRDGTKKTVTDLIAAHGGLSEKRLSLRAIRLRSKEKWFWQVPEFKDHTPPRISPGLIGNQS